MEKQKTKKLVIIPAILLLLTISVNAEWTTNLTEYFDYSEGANGILNYCNLTSGNATKNSNGYLFNATKKNYLEYDCKLNNQTTIMIWYNNTKGYSNLINSKYYGSERNGDFSIVGNITLSRYYSGNVQDNTGNAYNGNYNEYTLAIAEHTIGKINISINNSNWTSDTTTKSQGFGSGAESLNLGRAANNNAWVGWYEGEISKIAIWDRLLTNEEKTALNTSGYTIQIPLMNLTTWQISTEGTKITNRTINVTCTNNSYGGHIENISILVNNTNTNKEIRVANNHNYTINNNDFNTTLMLSCEICNGGYCSKQLYLENVSEIDHIFKIIYTTPYGTTITYPTTTWNNHSITDASTGYNTVMASQIINRTHNYTETITFTDRSGQYQTSNYSVPHNNTWNWTSITVTPNKLTLNFYNRTQYNLTSGIITDGIISKNFTGSQLQYSLTNFTEDYIKVYYGMKKGENYTQYYEHNNNYTGISEDIELLDNANWQIWFKTLSGDTQLEGTRIRVRQAKSSEDGTWQTSELIGQRYTGGKGTTMFWNDENAVMYVLAWKDGYEPKEFIFPVGDSSYTQDNPYEIYMTESTWGAYSNTYLYGMKTIRNKSLDINYTLWQPWEFTGSNNPQYTTAYRQSQGLPAVTITENAVLSQRWYFTLRSGTDFNTADGNITLYIYENYQNRDTKQFTIEHITRDQNNLLGLEGVKSNYVIVLIFIMSILISGAVSKIVKTPTSGATTFDVMTIIITFVNPIFAWLTAITALKYILRWIGGFINQE